MSRQVVLWGMIFELDESFVSSEINKLHIGVRVYCE